VKYFLLVYDRRRGKLLEEREFADSTIALRARFALERETDNKDIEIVVLGAESAAVIRQTHARYFQTISELAANL
jgi:hypothetical protein